MIDAKEQAWGVWWPEKGRWVQFADGGDWRGSASEARYLEQRYLEVCEARPYRPIDNKERTVTSDPGGPPWGWGVWNLIEGRWSLSDGRPWAGSEYEARQRATVFPGMFEARPYPRDDSKSLAACNAADSSKPEQATQLWGVWRIQANKWLPQHVLGGGDWTSTEVEARREAGLIGLGCVARPYGPPGCRYITCAVCHQQTFDVLSEKCATCEKKESHESPGWKECNHCGRPDSVPSFVIKGKCLQCWADGDIQTESSVVRRTCVRCDTSDAPSLNMLTDLCRACEVDGQNREMLDAVVEIKSPTHAEIESMNPGPDQFIVYGTDTSTGGHLRRCLVTMEDLAAAGVITRLRALGPQRANALADECQRLRDELTKANAEKTEVLAENARLRRSLERATKGDRR